MKYVLFFSLFFSSTLFAQNDYYDDRYDDMEEYEFESIFKAYIAAGLNVAQIRGDTWGGYNKVGGNIGVGTYIMFEDFFSMSMEIGYSMRGSQQFFGGSGNPLIPNQRLVTDYIQLPVQAHYHNDKFGVFGGGLNLGYLIRKKYINAFTPGRLDNLTPLDLSFVASYTYIIKENFGVNLTFNYSLSNNINNSALRRRGGWYHNVLSIRGYYLF